MRAIYLLNTVFHAVARRVAAARTRPAFYCGQCERWERCGLPPSEDCIVRLAQIERDGGRSITRSAAWWRVHANLGS
jgi:hypothetical protein